MTTLLIGIALYPVLALVIDAAKILHRFGSFQAYFNTLEAQEWLDK
jgi:hypothetical protein